MLKRLKFQN